MNKVAIVDHGMCNLDSIARAIEKCGGEAHITDRPKDLEVANRIVLPGVGAFPDAMENLETAGLAEAIKEQVIEQRIPLLAVCLGMQLLMESSEEVRETKGLGLVQGTVKRLEPNGSQDRIPHMGWNELRLQKEEPLFAGVPEGADFYFVHSFVVTGVPDEEVVATTPYCGGFVSALAKDNIRGVQFHPEKSQRVGFKLLSNFLSI
ncbi:MAG: imidazole glycerol-phosphate synthase subunit HisH [Actinomycetota bacterium]|jgi:glutamine amidotransferase|nr:imidazole glycerol-phosphate synthase subunit HisH [Actinomycetota bacterium]